MKSLFPFIIVFLTFCSCEKNKVTESGGLIIDVMFANRGLPEPLKDSIVNLLTIRLQAAGAEEPVITKYHDSLHIELPLESDSAAYRLLVSAKGYLRLFEAMDLPALYPELVHIDTVLQPVRATRYSKLFSALVLNTDNEGKPMKEPILGFCATKDTVLVGQLLRKAIAGKLISPTLQFRWDLFESFGSRALYAYEQAAPLADQSMLRSITEDAASVYLKSEHHDRWQKITRQLTGAHVLVLIDDQVFSSPAITGTVTDGLVFSPSPGSDMLQWKYIFALLKSGTIETELKILRMQHVNSLVD